MNALTESVPQEVLTSERHPYLLFFDGECAFCDRWVNRVRASDHAGRMRFGTKQGRTFQRVAQAHPELAKVESVVLAKRRADGGEDFLVRSVAIRQLIQGLPNFRFFDFVLSVTPSPLADVGYRIFSKFRTRLFGKLTQCRVPSAEERHLFVE
jgi:predicted DCC family thiol-disulfide oxidoreductase YuxK